MEVAFERDTEQLDLGGDFFTHVEAVGELAAENSDNSLGLVDLDGVFATELGPVDVFLVAFARIDDKWAHARALGDDVVPGQRCGEIHTGVDLVEQEIDVGIVNFGVWRVDACVGGADHGPATHRNHIEESLGVVVERQHLVVVVRRQPGNHEMDALRVDDAVLRREPPLLIRFVDKRPRSVHDRACRRCELLARVDAPQCCRPLVV